MLLGLSIRDINMGSSEGLYQIRFDQLDFEGPMNLGLETFTCSEIGNRKQVLFLILNKVQHQFH